MLKKNPRSSPPATVAAVDLGSNSFHLVVANPDGHDLKIVDRLREMVRLAAGLCPDGTLDDDAQARALECLGRFGQRLRDLPPGAVRAVGTNTLRRIRRGRFFLAEAERALGHPIEVVSGVEEARLIYLGVIHSVGANSERRLVVDIGGGSTEFVIGEGAGPRLMESLHMGCVSLSEAHFPDGSISREAMKRAEVQVRVELEPVEVAFQTLGWDGAVGASGTIKAVAAVLAEEGWAEHGITRSGLEKLRDALVKAGHVRKLGWKALSDSRRPVFAGGVAALCGIFKALDLEAMAVSDGALREGLLVDLVGRIRHEDVRDQTVRSLASRYHVDPDQALRVEATVSRALADTGAAWSLDPEDCGQWLRWAAWLHEIGLDISHSQYHKHGEYILRHSDMAGFSRQEQLLLAFLVRAHRRKFPGMVLAELPENDRDTAARLVVLLRLAVLLHRGRGGQRPPEVGFGAAGQNIELRFPAGWLDEHPLTQADLEAEARLLKSAGFGLEWDC